MVSLIEKLNTINALPLKKISNGRAESLEEFWDNFVAEHIPDSITLKKWHRLLIDYVNSIDPLLVIRGYNVADKGSYGDLRRGFLTKDIEFSYFFTDNYFASYFYKMASERYVPTLQEFIIAMKTRKFPSRFGRNTKEERELAAIPQGKDPGINLAGYKIAHIIPVGKEYCVDGIMRKGAEILNNYFPRGKRNDWVKQCSENGASYYLRSTKFGHEAKAIATAYFLRFVHPFNYVLAPKKNFEKNNVCVEIAEYQDFLNYAHNYFLKNYRDEYNEYLSYLMADNKFYNELAFNNKLFIEYFGNPVEIESNVDNIKNNDYIKSEYRYDKKDNSISINKNDSVKTGRLYRENEDWLPMLYRFLTDSSTSFRKLEREYMHIDSAERGGGFISRKIINNMGFTASDKGILENNRDKITELLQNSIGIRHLSLFKLTKLLNYSNKG